MDAETTSNDHLRNRALTLFRITVEAADPERATRESILLEDGRLSIRLDNEDVRQGDWRHVRAVAIGKAACAMAAALEDLRSTPLWRGPGLAITDYGNVRDVPGFEVHGSGHPLPDAAGVRAAQQVADAAAGLGDGDMLLVLLSGGGSAILPSPADGITLEEKIATTDLLLGCGANINELNTIRKHLSLIKGGGLARLASPASLHALILSDVIGDDLSTIASGPTVADPTTFADARTILERHNLLSRVPPAVRERFLRGQDGAIDDTPKPGDPVFSGTGATLVGGNSRSLATLRAAAGRGDGTVRTLGKQICGEARLEARNIAAAACVELTRETSRPLTLVAGGETTVTVVGSGSGGRNQELALAFALEAERIGLPGDWVFLGGGTDGRDGPTDAAGGLVDPRTLRRIRAAGLDPQALLDDNDSHRALEAAGDLLVTGATGTNVADLQVFLAG